jgi:hypothetical protein
MNPFFIENERIPSFLMSVKDEPWQREKGDNGLETMELNPAEDHYWSVE